MEDRISRNYSPAGYMLMVWLAAFLGWWFFALAPLPVTSPQWVETARKVCFGSLPNGLPEGYGWLTLVCSPLLMLTVLVLVWSRELGRDVQLASTTLIGRSMIVAVVVLPAISLMWGVKRVVEVSRAYSQTIAPNFVPGELPETYPTYSGVSPELNLVNQHQEIVTLDSLKGKPFILTFAFAHCGTICPGLVTTVMEAAESYQGERPVVVFVTLDPWRDTPASLPTLAKQWKLGVADHVLSGSVKEVQSVIDSYEVSTTRNLQNGDIGHPGMAFLFDAEARMVYRFNDPSVEWLQEALDRL
ncbi:MAG: SCO family protein [Candidatus Eremiobacteraeota bacterium]|nr:SCO family protein [Candidatus Eremiobacteraeota bacterium]